MNNLPSFLISTSINQRFAHDMVDATEIYRPLLATWLIKMSLSLKWFKNTGRHPGFLLENEGFALITGIAVETGSDEDRNDILLVNGKSIRHIEAVTIRILKNHLARTSKLPMRDDMTLFSNINLLGKVLALTEAEKAILCFTSVMDIFTVFQGVISSRQHQVSTKSIGEIISKLTEQPESAISLGLKEDATLVASGLIVVKRQTCDMEQKLTLLDGLGDLLLQTHENAESLIGQFLKKAGKPSLTLNDFPHLASDTKALQAYLSNALDAGEQGTNILFYGIPGTGKTEFVKALADELDVDLYEISFSDSEGNPISGVTRLRAYNLCQRALLHKKNALLMFDEIEDVFPSQDETPSFFGPSHKGRGNESGKAWINRTLERNATPAIWVTNDAVIDPAYLRRFDYSVNFAIPPQQVRTSIVRHHLGQFNPSEEWLNRIASNEQTIPAQYEHAAKVARVSSGKDMEMARLLVEQTLDRSATLLGQKRTPTRNTIHTGYDRRFINANLNAEKIIAGLKNKPRGTFCFYGPAGTGKSEFARHLADEIGKPFILKRASDILSMWVGGSEKNIAQMFSEARQQNAVLVLDEADSFLADRRDARHGWEVTQVNELLTQMEAFEGIFMCTTNLMEKLDQASLRRFAFKVKFDYLNADQRWGMFLNEITRLGGDVHAASDWEIQVRRLEKLTPGDFAVVARQYAILDIPVTAGELYRQLLEECQVKGGATGKIGFV